MPGRTPSGAVVGPTAPGWSPEVDDSETYEAPTAVAARVALPEVGLAPLPASDRRSGADEVAAGEGGPSGARVPLDGSAAACREADGEGAEPDAAGADPSETEPDDEAVLPGRGATEPGDEAVPPDPGAAEPDDETVPLDPGATVLPARVPDEWEFLGAGAVVPGRVAAKDRDGAEAGAVAAAEAAAESAATVAAAADVGATERRTLDVGSASVPDGRNIGRASVRRIALASGRGEGAVEGWSADAVIGEPANMDRVDPAAASPVTPADAWVPVVVGDATAGAAARAGPAGAATSVPASERRRGPEAKGWPSDTAGAVGRVPGVAVTAPGIDGAAGAEGVVGVPRDAEAEEDKDEDVDEAVEGEAVDDKVALADAGDAAAGDAVGDGGAVGTGACEGVGAAGDRRIVGRGATGVATPAAFVDTVDRGLGSTATAAARRAPAVAAAWARRRRSRPDGAGRVPVGTAAESVAAEGARSPVTADDARPDPPSFPGRAGGSVERAGAGARMTRVSDGMVILPVARTSSETRTGIVCGARRAVEAPGR